jgi:hypothetical protein
VKTSDTIEAHRGRKQSHLVAVLTGGQERGERALKVLQILDEVIARLEAARPGAFHGAEHRGRPKSPVDRGLGRSSRQP